MQEIAKKTFSRGNTLHQQKLSSNDLPKPKVSSKFLDIPKTNQSKYKLSINNTEVSEFVQTTASTTKSKNQHSENNSLIRTATMNKFNQLPNTTKKNHSGVNSGLGVDDKFSFDIDEYRRKSDKTKSSGKLRQIFEEKKSICDYKQGKRRTKIKIARMRCFFFLEKMVENCISQLERFKMLEDSESFAERVIVELTKTNKNPEIIAQLLEKLPGFKRFMCIMGIQRKTLFQAADKLCWQNLKPEEYVFREHDTSDNFYCILTGKVELSKTKFIDKEQENLQFQHKESMIHHTRRATVRAHNKIIKYEEPFTTLKEGEIFGEYGLIDNKNRLANAKAITEVNLLVVNKSCFKQYFKSSIEKVLIERKLFLLAHFPLFSSFNKDEFQNLFLKMVIRPYNKGKAIVSEGTKADRIYMILKGGVCKLNKQHKSEEIHLLTLLEGDIFGLESSSKRNFNEIMDNKKIKIENPTAELNYKLDLYDYSVYSNSDNTILIELNLVTSDIYKSDFFEFLYSLHLKKRGIIDKIFEKNIKQREKFKPKYKIDVLNQKVGKQQEEYKYIAATRQHKPLIFDTKNEFKKFSIENTQTSYTNQSLSTDQSFLMSKYKNIENEKLNSQRKASILLTKSPFQFDFNSSLLTSSRGDSTAFNIKKGSILKLKGQPNLTTTPKIKSSITNLTKKCLSKCELKESPVFIDKQVYELIRAFKVKMRNGLNSSEKVTHFETENFCLPLISNLLVNKNPSLTK